MKKESGINIQPLNILLERYRKKIKPPQSSIEKECLAVIHELTPLKLSQEQISYTVSTKTVYINAPSVLKSELQFYQTDIIRALRKRLGEQSAPLSIL